MADFSIGSWSFHSLHRLGKMNLFGYMESMKFRYRLDHVDIWNGMMLSTENDYIQSVKDTLVEDELTVANLAVDGADVWHDDSAVRERNREKAFLYFDIARRWGVRNVRIDMGVTTVDMTDEQYEFCVNRYREYARVAYDNGFRVGPQTHQPASCSPKNLVRMSNDISAPGFGIILNVNRWLSDKETGDEITAPLTCHVQFDRAFVDFTGPELIQKIQLLRQAGYRGCWSMEFRGGINEYQEVERDLQTIRQAVKLAARQA
ncbi:sugar phosphate isomerase/epimerase family protein [Cohnella herbarum]|uniref:Xylose isomerase-like TIM barrel domain-containing protein n=1 Tax=Cohnella herbarum TaxID=2728023 RepID=A0A7Z2VQP5_9BACL|nr:hypothetical protein [Cohnella herbarum]QJD87716.1 hypothetical protein HH215_34025 [Cohnella herbarum]